MNLYPVMSLSVSPSKNRAAGETWCEKTLSFWLCKLTIGTIRIKENRQYFPCHAGPLSYTFIELHWKWRFQGQMTIKSLLFLKFLSKIQWCRDQIMVFSNRESILEWYFIVRSVGFWHACFWFFPILPDSYKHLHLISKRCVRNANGKREKL